MRARQLSPGRGGFGNALDGPADRTESLTSWSGHFPAMSNFPFACPKSPDWRVDWDALDQEYEWIRAMRDCPQDPIFHAEGDVWIHVRKVCRALVPQNK